MGGYGPGAKDNKKKAPPTTVISTFDIDQSMIIYQHN